MITTEVDKKKENIFDLTKLAPIEINHEIQKASTIISVDEQTKLLQGFSEIHHDDWKNLKLYDYVRYLRKDGAFRRGGYFKNSWVGSYGKNKGNLCIQLASKKNFNSATWVVCFNDIDKMWKNEDINETHAEKKNNIDTNEIQETIQFMSKAIEQLKIDLLKMNNEQKRIINLIKKLHGIKISSH